MEDIKQVDGLSINQDLDFQRRTWAVQRIGWVAMVMIILAALLGLLGPGLMSEAKISTPGDAVQLVYQRVARVQAPTRLEIFLQSSHQRNGLARLSFDRRYLRAVTIKHITPQPRDVEASADYLTYIFSILPSDQYILISFDLEPGQFGLLSGRLEVPEHQPLLFQQFIYP